MNETVWVVSEGVDSQGGSVLGVCGTLDSGKALAEDGPQVFDWSEIAGTSPGQVEVWLARAGGDRWLEVARWEVSR